MISKFFIERPVLANVLAILMILIATDGLTRAPRSFRSAHMGMFESRGVRFSGA